MNTIHVFKNEQFGGIRAADIDSEPWFVGKDVTEALGYSKHVDPEDKRGRVSRPPPVSRK